MPADFRLIEARQPPLKECMGESSLEFVWVMGENAVDPLAQAQTFKTREEAAQRPPSPAIPGERTKREHFLDRLRR